MLLKFRLYTAKIKKYKLLYQLCSELHITLSGGVRVAHNTTQLNKVKTEKKNIEKNYETLRKNYDFFNINDQIKV